MSAKKDKKLKGVSANKSKKKIVEESGSTDKECPVWVFTEIDKAGEFAFDLNRDEFRHQEVLEKMINYSNMTWSDIKKQTHDDRKSKHHAIAYEALSKAAQERLKAKHLEEDSDAVFSFALNNLLRIIGIRRGKEFSVLWYDPNHEVCPSTKKHT